MRVRVSDNGRNASRTVVFEKTSAEKRNDRFPVPTHHTFTAFGLRVRPTDTVQYLHTLAIDSTPPLGRTNYLLSCFCSTVERAHAATA